MVTVITWPTIVGIMLIVVMASLSWWWWWRRRQMKDSGVNAKLAERASTAIVESPIGASYQDQTDQVAIEPVADMK